MNLKVLFQKTLSVKYIHTEQEKGSYYAVKEKNCKGGYTLNIFFQGSNGDTDWKNNFDFPAKPYRDMSNMWFAHRGFLKVWKEIEPVLKPFIMDEEITHIIISGYSHGAALALLCHEYCKFNRASIEIEGYGFGSPRVVWGVLQKNVKQRFEGFTVIRNGCDIVTYVPPLWLGYRQVGELLEIGQDKGYKAVESHYSSNILKELEALKGGKQE